MTRLVCAILMLFAMGAAPVQAPRAPVVLAAASLQESLTAAGDVWVRRGHPRPVLSFAASSALARQIAAGAPADLFLSADAPWMDDLAARGLIVPQSRVNLLGNRLVLVAPVASRATARGRRWRDLGALLGPGRLALADPAAVPAGRYAEAALRRLGAWPDVSAKVVAAENVRAALALVERGAAPFGIVYATDAKASRKVRVVAVLPAESHPPIVYPIARLKRSTNREAEDFRRFLIGPQGRAVFARYGFPPPR